MDQSTFSKIKKISQETNTDIHKLLGNFYMKTNDTENSIKNYEIYISTNPDDAIVLGVLGYLYDKLYLKTRNNLYIEKAIKYTEKAHSIQKHNESITLNLATFYKDVGLTDKAFKLWPEILKNDPSDKNCYDYALINLKMGNFNEYYKHAEHRLNIGIANHFYPKFKQPQWHGEDISNSILLVHWEQGFGDTIMYSRYLKEISNRAKKVIFIVQKELEELFKNNDFGCEVYSDISQVKEFDYHVPLISLLEISGASAENLIYTDKYLNVDKEMVDNFKNLYFKSDKYKIAIKNKGDKSGPLNRNIPSEKFIKTFGKLKNTEVYSFQFEDDYKNSNIINLKGKTENFYETAAIIENMDLVITTDNVILHLAGALGKRTFGLFNFATEGRWFNLASNNTKWYKSVKPYVATELNSWESIINKVLSDLA